MDEAYQIQWKSAVANGREIMSATVPCGPHFSADIRHNKPHSLREQDIFVHSTVAVIVEPTKYQITRFATMTEISGFSVDLATSKLLEGVMSFFRQAISYPERVNTRLRESVHSELREFQDAMHRMNAPFFVPPNSPNAQQIRNHSEGLDYFHA